MNSKEINRDSGGIFGALLLPSWARRSQEDQEDYGVDFEIEVMTPEDKASGLIFKVQLKGTTIATYNDESQLVYSGASVARFGYYFSHLKIPLIFVVCDVTTRQCYWIKMQGNRRLEADYQEAVAKNQDTFTLKIPCINQFERTLASAERVLEAVEDSANVITLKGVQALKPDSVRLYMGNASDVEKTEKQFRLFAGLAADEAIHKMIRVGDLQAACEKARNLLESPSESPEIRILGGWRLSHSLNLKLRKSREPGADFKAAQYKLGIGIRLLEIARGKDCEVRLKRYSRIFVRAARMQVNGRVATALVFSEKVQAQQVDTMAGPITRIQRMEVSALVARDFLKLCKTLFRLCRDGFYSLAAYALAEITECTFPIVTALRNMDNSALADGYVDALFDFVPICLNIVRRFENKNDVEAIVSSLGVRLIALGNPNEATSMTNLLSRYEAALQETPAFECKDVVVTLLREQIRAVTAGSSGHAKPTVAELRHFIADRAAELGIDLKDPTIDLERS
jgi:hypothetical protein